jgi:hypothetical protein
MPVPLEVSAAQLDLSQRFVASTAIVGSPALAAETIVAQITCNTDLVIVSGIRLDGFIAFTVGTTGTAVTARLRRTNVAGTVIASTGAITQGVAAAGLDSIDVSGFDTGAALTGQIYVLTLQVTGGAAASTVSATALFGVII